MNRTVVLFGITLWLLITVVSSIPVQFCQEMNIISLKKCEKCNLEQELIEKSDCCVKKESILSADLSIDNEECCKEIQLTIPLLSIIPNNKISLHNYDFLVASYGINSNCTTEPFQFQLRKHSYPSGEIHQFKVQPQITILRI
mgnify:CR=1 FL=1